MLLFPCSAHPSFIPKPSIQNSSNSAFSSFCPFCLPSLSPSSSEHRRVPGREDDLRPVRMPGHVPDHSLVPCRLLDNLSGEQVVDDNPASSTAKHGGHTAIIDVPLFYWTTFANKQITTSVNLEEKLALTRVCIQVSSFITNINPGILLYDKHQAPDMFWS